MVLLVLCPLASGVHATTTDAHQPDIRTSDVDRFFQLYDRTHGQPSEAQLQSRYLDRGTDGLKQFVTSRIDNAGKLAAAIAKAPQVYAEARHCASALPAVRRQLRGVFTRLASSIRPRRFRRLPW